MKNNSFITIALLPMIIFSLNTKTVIKKETGVQRDSTKYVSKSFFLKDLVEKRIESGEPFIRFLNVPTIKMFIYSLPAGGVDKQTPHKLDEVYYVTSGDAELSVENKNYKVSPGSIIYVKAGAKHKFHSIKKDLTVIVFFSTAKPK